MAGLDLGETGRLTETLQPGAGELFNLFELLGVKEVEAVIVIVVLSAGDELA